MVQNPYRRTGDKSNGPSLLHQPHLSFPSLIRPPNSPLLGKTCSIAPHSFLVSTPYLQAFSPFAALSPTLNPFPTVVYFPSPLSSLFPLRLSLISSISLFQHPLSACNASFLPLETPSLLSLCLLFFSHAPATPLREPSSQDTSIPPPIPSPHLRDPALPVASVSKPPNHLQCLPPAQPSPLET